MGVTKKPVNEVKQLLEKEANPLLQNGQGQTAMQLAENLRYTEIVDVFQQAKPFHQEHSSARFPKKNKRRVVSADETSVEEESKAKKQKVEAHNPTTKTSEQEPEGSLPMSRQPH